MAIHVKQLTAAGLLVLCAALMACGSSSNGSFNPVADQQARHVILLIGDGMGTWHVDAAAKHAGRPLVMTSLNVHGYMTTFMRNMAQDQGPYADEYWDDGSQPGSFDPRRGGKTPWDPTADPDYLRLNATDSAASASAILNGHKTVKYALNVKSEREGYPSQAVSSIQYHPTIVEIAESLDMATGVVTSVNFNHATPAAALVKTPFRKNYGEKTLQLLESDLEVIMGAGHPAYDDDGALREPDYQSWSRNHGPYLEDANGEALFHRVMNKAAERVFMQTKAEFEDLADGDHRYKGRQVPRRIFGLAQVADTLQYRRSSGGTQAGSPNQVAQTKLDTVPSLAVMTTGALAVLQQNSHGFWLLVEGGAIDWASHANDMARMIEELLDFDNAVEAVIQWVNDPTNDADWSNTLIIVSADHETGQLQPVGDASGQDVVAGQCWGVDCRGWAGHTNALVPIYAQGVGAQSLGAAFDGDYRDNTDIFKTMHRALVNVTP